MKIVLNWFNDGKEIKTFTGSVIRSSKFYFKEGMTWALRTSRFRPSLVCKGSIPSVSRYCALSEKTNIFSVIALCNSTTFDALVKLSLERHGHPKFIVGIVNNTPFISLEKLGEDNLKQSGFSAWSTKRNTDTANQTSHAFYAPALTPRRTKPLSTHSL